jgi:hypothetical protein
MPFGRCHTLVVRLRDLYAYLALIFGRIAVLYRAVPYRTVSCRSFLLMVCLSVFARGASRGCCVPHNSLALYAFVSKPSATSSPVSNQLVKLNLAIEQILRRTKIWRSEIWT